MDEDDDDTLCIRDAETNTGVRLFKKSQLIVIYNATS